MDISQPNNAVGDIAEERRFGIRVSAPPEDPFTRLVGQNWHSYRWFASREERDQALQEMAARHRYSRVGDVPSIVLAAIEKPAAGDRG